MADVENPKQKAIRNLMTKALVLMVLFYIVIVIIDAAFHPTYTGWMVALFTICGLLIGVALGFNMAYKIRFSTVMKPRSDKEMIKDIKNHGSKTRGFGLDDKE